mgnify:CR=1 FL=1
MVYTNNSILRKMFKTPFDQESFPIDFICNTPLDESNYLDLETEKETRRLFNSDDFGSIDIEDLLQITVTGVHYCCDKRSKRNIDCNCIQRRFQSKSIFTLYLLCRRFFLQELATMILAKLFEDTKK